MARSSNSIPDNVFGTGRIAEIISAVKSHYKVASVSDLSTELKVTCLSKVLQLSPADLDNLITDNSPVFRTVKGHVFETVFDSLVKEAGYEIEEIGGDDSCDRKVNGFSLQLKTPTLSGTSGSIVQYKTHKTHGAKSERESMEYYHGTEEFADFLVGLVSYEPLRILILRKDELPTHTKSQSRIKSPFSIDWEGHPALNAFNRIGIKSLGKSLRHILPRPDCELLPRTSQKMQVSSDIILNTILKENNFRIWDMSIRGFAREVAIRIFLLAHNICLYNPCECRKERGDKADLALKSLDGKRYKFFQTKGVSTNNCCFIGKESLVAIETQLTRGRVNDHATQSRLYLHSDFDYLLIGLDPCLSLIYRKENGKIEKLAWEFYAVPTSDLKRHPTFSRRIKSLQTFRYADLQRYRITRDWMELWTKDSRISSVLLTEQTTLGLK